MEQGSPMSPVLWIAGLNKVLRPVRGNGQRQKHLTDQEKYQKLQGELFDIMNGDDSDY